MIAQAVSGADDIFRFVQLRVQTASEWFDEAGEQLLASEMHECFAALDRLAARLAAAEANRDQWHSAANENAERTEAAEAREAALQEAMRLAVAAIGHGPSCSCDICNPIRAALAVSPEGE